MKLTLSHKLVCDNLSTARQRPALLGGLEQVGVSETKDPLRAVVRRESVILLFSRYATTSTGANMDRHRPAGVDARAILALCCTVLSA